MATVRDAGASAGAGAGAVVIVLTATNSTSGYVLLGDSQAPSLPSQSQQTPILPLQSRALQVLSSNGCPPASADVSGWMPTVRALLRPLYDAAIPAWLFLWRVLPIRAPLSVCPAISVPVPVSVSVYVYVSMSVPRPVLCVVVYGIGVLVLGQHLVRYDDRDTYPEQQACGVFEKISFALLFLLLWRARRAAGAAAAAAVAESRF
ncbi:hypothetical protein E4U13_008019 [Claviceps humidiphila]|uniref:Uncharacterized protein n=1 Tax=Claviceps humidiphila TaxID=1294629 RepID=A0A9P7Q3L1_9HYPO|nr:hypothetical protein E4U13_008019 [Claviceps humidiphila]